MRTRDLAVLLLALGLTAPAAPAQPLCPDSTRLARAEAAFHAHRYAEVVAALDGLHRRCDRPEAHALLARVLLQDEVRDLARAEEAIEAALRLAPEEPRYLSLRLRLMQLAPGDFIPVYAWTKRTDLARRILALDSTDAAANAEMGLHAAETYFATRHLLRPALFKGGNIYEDDLGIFIGQRELEAVQQFGIHREGGRVVERGVEYQGHLAQGGAYARFRFDVERLRAMGVQFVDMTAPAREAYPLALRHLTRALQEPPADPVAFDALARLYAASGAWQALWRLARQARADRPDDAALLLVEGLARYQQGDLDGAAAAFDAARSRLDAATRAVFDDLSRVLPPKEADAYRRDPGAYAAAYWRLNDPRLLTEANEQRVEHTARLVYADLLFAAPKLNRRGWDTDRGRIYVRYGAPEAIHAYPFIFYAGASRGHGSGKGAPDAAVETAGGRTEIWSYDGFRFVFEDPFLLKEFVLFSPPAAAFAVPHTDPTAQDFVIQARERIREEPVRSAYAATASMPYLASAFKGDDGSADLYVAFGVPVAEPAGPGDLPLALRTGVFALDAAGAAVAEHRTSPAAFPREQIHALPQARLYLDAAHLRLPPGPYTLSVEFDATGGSVAAFDRSTLTVPAFAADALALSDLMLAYRVEETAAPEAVAAGAIYRRGFEVTAAPWTVFARRQPLYLYFEVYGLETDAGGQARYEVEAALVPVDERRGLARVRDRLWGREAARRVAARVEGSGAGRDQGQYLLLDVAAQEAGTYDLVVRVRQGRQA